MQIKLLVLIRVIGLITNIPHANQDGVTSLVLIMK